MTTAAMVFGVIPLVLASGAGAAGTSSMGKVIFTGLALGTFFTLFVVPAMYYFLAADHHQVKEKNSDGATDDIETVSSH
jgi:multidrug efflux pump